MSLKSTVRKLEAAIARRERSGLSLELRRELNEVFVQPADDVAECAAVAASSTDELKAEVRRVRAAAKMTFEGFGSVGALHVRDAKLVAELQSRGEMVSAPTDWWWDT